MTRLQIRAVAFARFWHMCEQLGDTDGQAFAHWVTRRATRHRWRESTRETEDRHHAAP